MPCAKLRYALLLGAAANVWAYQDARAVVQRAVDHELAGASDARNFTYCFREVSRKLPAGKAPLVGRDETSEVMILYGKAFTRLIERDGKALAPQEQAKARERFEREVARRAALSEQQRAREDGRLRRQDAQRVEFIRQIPDLYTFSQTGTGAIDGRPVLVIDANPKLGAAPRGLTARNLCQLNARLWIDQAEQRWVKVEAEARKTIVFGWVLARIGEGSRITFEQTRVGDGVWLPKRIEGTFFARVFGARLALASETRFFDYKRFGAESKIVSETGFQ